MPENYAELQVRFTVSYGGNLIVEIQDQGFIGYKTVSPLQFEIIYKKVVLFHGNRTDSQ